MTCWCILTWLGFCCGLLILTQFWLSEAGWNLWFSSIIFRMSGESSHNQGMMMSQAWDPDYVFGSKSGNAMSRGCRGILLKLFVGFCLIIQQSSWVYWFHSGRPAIRPASSVCSVAPTVLVGSISYLYIFSSNFRWCVACKVICKILICEFLAIFFKFVTLTLSWFDLGSDVNH